MVRQGWLEPVRLPGGPGYALTPRATRRLDDAADRIYHRGAEDWDGHWHLVVIARVPDRSARERLRNGLAYLGYAPLDDATWISPRSSPELDSLLTTEQVRAERFTAEHDGDSLGLIRRAWDLEGLARSYSLWLSDAEQIAAGAGPDAGDELAFATRSRLVHEWRKFLFTDPGLPRTLLPTDWPGEKAAAFFAAESGRLLPVAARYVDACLAEPNPPA